MATGRVFHDFTKDIILEFEQLGLEGSILRNLSAMGHSQPTPIQISAIPIALEGRDIVGLAQTGTGKTAAFLLPMLQNFNNSIPRGKFRPIRGLILSPTRELASQIFDKLKEYAQSHNIRAVCAIGGVPIFRQEKSLSKGTDILIATPGRLLDLAKRKAIRLDHVETLVLDEADHMLDIGFLPDIRRIIAQLPKKRQSMLFSATMPPPIRELAEKYLDNPAEVSVVPTTVVADKIEQQVRHLTGGERPAALVDLLQEHEGKRALVFTRTKHGADKVVRNLGAKNIEAAAIHGNKSQNQRVRALKAFHTGNCKVLIATDIAARGIDIPDVGLVVNYELPEVSEVYIHRIGRTARAGASGMAVAFCTVNEIGRLYAIEKLLKQAIPAEGKVPQVPKKGEFDATSKSRRRRPSRNSRPQQRRKKSNKVKKSAH